jgi:hypothetical protein
MAWWQWIGLVLLVTTVAISVGFLLYDYFWLELRGKLTISEQVWHDWQAWRTKVNGVRQGRFPIRAIILPVLMLAAPLGLVIHFIPK